jgi:hypothetical protein
VATKFNIGDAVWRPTFDNEQEWIECPDCGGTGRLRVTFHDDTTVSIECANCARGYEPPTGKVSRYVRHPEAHQGMISGIEINSEGVEYRFRQGEHSSWMCKEEDLSDTHEEAMVKAQAMAEEAAAEENRRIFRKEKDTRTWAWNASYHRKCIKEAQRNFEYHTRKLDAANLKVPKEKSDAKVARTLS